mgnify:FL=1
MHSATLFLSILAAGLASRWLARNLSLPSIVVPIAVGLVLGPGTGLIEFSVLPTSREGKATGDAR